MRIVARTVSTVGLLVLLLGCSVTTASQAPARSPSTTVEVATAMPPETAKPAATVARPTTVPVATTSSSFVEPRRLVVVTEEDGAGLDWLRKTAAAFRSTSGREVDVVHEDRDHLRVDVETAALAGQAPDLLWTVSSTIAPLVAAQLLRPADDLFNAVDFASGPTAAAQLDGRQWGVPVVAGNHLVLYYNKRLIPSPPRTTDALLNLSHPQGADVVLASNRGDPLWLMPWLSGLGGKLFDGGRPALSSPEMVASLQLLKSLREKNVLVTEPDFGASVAHFKIGKVAMIVDGSWAAPDYAAAASGSRSLDLGITSLPMLSSTNHPATPLVSGSYLLASASLSGERLDTARAFVAFVTSLPVQMRVALELRQLPALKAALGSPAVQGDALLRPLADALPNTAPLPARPEMRPIWSAMQAPVAAVLAGEKEPEAAAQEMQSTAAASVKTGQ